MRKQISVFVLAITALLMATPVTVAEQRPASSLQQSSSLEASAEIDRKELARQWQEVKKNYPLVALALQQSSRVFLGPILKVGSLEERLCSEWRRQPRVLEAWVYLIRQEYAIEANPCILVCINECAERCSSKCTRDHSECLERAKTLEQLEACRRRWDECQRSCVKFCPDQCP